MRGLEHKQGAVVMRMNHPSQGKTAFARRFEIR